MNDTASLPFGFGDLAAIANRLRRHVIKMTYFAGSGHPGGSLSRCRHGRRVFTSASCVSTLHDRSGPSATALLCQGSRLPGLVCGTGRAALPVSDLWGLRRSDSHLQGHPDMRKTPGVDMTSGPLGSGLAAGVGMALGARITGRQFSHLRHVGRR